VKCLNKPSFNVAVGEDGYGTSSSERSLFEKSRVGNFKYSKTIRAIKYLTIYLEIQELLVRNCVSIYSNLFSYLRLILKKSLKENYVYAIQREWMFNSVIWPCVVVLYIISTLMFIMRRKNLSLTLTSSCCMW